MRLLLIEDHKPLVRSLKRGLEEEGFAVDVAEDGEEGNFKVRSANYDVVILDLMLPKVDGLTLLKNWRQDGMKTHVLILTARDSIENMVEGPRRRRRRLPDQAVSARGAAGPRPGPDSPASSGQGPDSARSRSGNRHRRPHRQTQRPGHPPHAPRVFAAAVPGLQSRQGRDPFDDLGPSLRRTR